MMINKTKVSVIIPLYNVEELIEETISGLMSQSLKEVEYILIDDGSEDMTVDIATKAINGDKRFILVSQENKGPAAARNHGLRLASGNFLCFVDSDDLLSENALEIMYDAAIEYDSELVTGAAVRFNSKGKWFIKAHVEKGLMKPGLKKIESNPELFYSIGPCAKLYKRSLIEGIFFPEHIRFGEDQPFVMHAYLNAKNIYTVNEIVYYYRLREGDNKSLTQSIKKNPTEILDFVLEMLNINQRNFEMKSSPKKLQAGYLERVMTHELWPALKESIKSKHTISQQYALGEVEKWVDSLDHELFNLTPAIRYFLIRGIVENFKFINFRSYNKYLQLLDTVVRKLSSETYNAFQTNHKIIFGLVKKSIANKNVIPVYLYTKKRNIQRKVNRQRLQNIFLKRIAFNFAKCLPRNKKKIVFATNKSEKLEGNFKNIYEEMFFNSSNNKFVFHLKEDRGFLKKLRMYLDFGTASVILLDDYYNQLYHLKIRKNTKVIQTWHACGAFKKFGFSAQGYRDANSLYFEKGAHSIYTDVITSSFNIAPHYAEAFNKEISKIQSIGVPRTDIFFDTDYIDYIKRKYQLKFSQLMDKKVILYAPTFRGTPKERVKFKLELDIKNMMNSLGEDYVLILKLHPSVREGVKIPEESKNFVIDLTTDGDINELLLITDVLITDYSSVIFEYSLLNRPVIFFAYDLDYYLSERGFYYEYQTLVPGPVVRTTDELIKKVNNKNFDYKKLKEFRDYFFDIQDGKSSKRFVQTFMSSE
ncbi:MAG: CDP-glycerol glycerophosphotransferase family protein [Bacillota bacterium]|nr:CDP-glycerol glycerophosphotransferase family protein [Bacillota bacterium]